MEEKKPSIAESITSATSSSKSTVSQNRKLGGCYCSRKIPQTCGPVFPACCNYNYFVPLPKYPCCPCNIHESEGHKKRLSKASESNDKPDEQQNECKCCSEKKCACCKSGTECDKEEDKVSEKNEESDKSEKSGDEDEEE